MNSTNRHNRQSQQNIPIQYSVRGGRIRTATNIRHSENIRPTQRYPNPPISPWSESPEQLDYLIELYNESNERPFLAPSELYNIELHEYEQLIDEGYDLDLSDQLGVISAAVSVNDYDLVKKLLPNYYRGVLTVKISTNPDILELLEPTFKVEFQSLSNTDMINTRRILYSIDNIRNHPELSVKVNYEHKLFVKCVKLLSVSNASVTVINRDALHNDMVVNNYVNNLDLELVRQDSLITLLTTSVTQGYVGLSRRILDTIDTRGGSHIEVANSLLDMDRAIGYDTLLVLARDYPYLSHNINRTFLNLIDLDHDMEYCMRDEYKENWELIKDELQYIDNSAVMATLRGRAPSYDKIIQSMSEKLSYNIGVMDIMVIETHIRYCRNVIPANDYISGENVEYIISLLGNSDDSDGDIMCLLIDLHNANHMDIRAYGEQHPYIEFIASRMISPRVKNARNTLH